MRSDGYTRIFVSYSHRGNGPRWKAALIKALQVFEQHHLLDVWQDGKIRVSSFWDDDIKQAMSNAQLAVVLLTKEALESQYIADTEFPFLRARQLQDGLPVFPVICEKCDWRAHDWLRATQAPNDSNPLAELSENAVDRVFRKLATDIAEELSRIALAKLPCPDQPLPTNRIFLEKFPIIQGRDQHEEKLIGREQELALLDLALGQAGTAIVSLVAWGGVGKSMLVKHWLKRLQHENWFGAERVYAWSFYSQGTKEDRQASEDTFLAHALEWFGVQCEPTLSPWDKGRLLADAVTCERTLLILDGIEPLQYPPGPMGGQLRAPGVQSLLKQLARKANNVGHRGLCLVTTRELLVDLADFQRRESSAWGSVLRVDLSNLTEEVGAALLYHAGATRAGAAEITPEDKELITASREVDGHALTLNLLGRFLVRAHGGDIRRRDLVKFEEADRNVQGGTTFKMLAAFENWFARSGDFGARQLAVLRILGLFDRPADTGCISALREPPVIAGLTDPLFKAGRDAISGQAKTQAIVDEDWNTATSFLADFSLITIQSDADDNQRLLDSHPLIREHFAARLIKRDAEAWRCGHRRLYEYLQDSADDQPVTLAGLQPLYEAVAHGCSAGLYCDTFAKVLIRRIDRGVSFGWKKLGACDATLNAVSCFFNQRWSRVVAFDDSHNGWLFNEAAVSLRALGRLSESIEPMRAALENYIRLKMWKSAAVISSSQSELMLTLGELPRAAACADESVRFSDRSADAFQRACSRGTLAHVLHQLGRSNDALIHFSEAEAIQAVDTPRLPLLYGLGGFDCCELLLSTVEMAVWQRLMAARKCVQFPAEQHIAMKAIQDLGSYWFDIEGYRGSLFTVERRCRKMYEWRAANDSLLTVALDDLNAGRTALYGTIIEGTTSALKIANRGLTLSGDENERASRWFAIMRETIAGYVSPAIEKLRHSGQRWMLPHGLLYRAIFCSIQGDAEGAWADLDEAWDIAERGPMRLHIAGIHLYRARLFFKEQHYPWKSPADDLAAAEKLINECGYHRRDEELADAKKAILGQ